MLFVHLKPVKNKNKVLVHNVHILTICSRLVPYSTESKPPNPPPFPQNREKLSPTQYALPPLFSNPTQ